MKKIIVFALGTLLVLALLASTATKLNACTEGCTPGFWKNHLDHWGPTGFSPDDTLYEVFSAYDPYGVWPAILLNPELAELADDTLFEALNYHGGKGLLGGARILFRQAVASLLNTAHPDVDYFWHSRTDRVELFIRALNSCLNTFNRDNYLIRSGYYEGFNETLPCPLSGKAKRH